MSSLGLYSLFRGAGVRDLESAFRRFATACEKLRRPVAPKLSYAELSDAHEELRIRVQTLTMAANSAEEMYETEHKRADGLSRGLQRMAERLIESLNRETALIKEVEILRGNNVYRIAPAE